MGLYDRDYVRPGTRSTGFERPRGMGGAGMGGWRPRTVTHWLILINVAVFVLDPILMRFGWARELKFSYDDRPVLKFAMGPLEYWGHFSEVLAVNYVQIWRFVTFQFLHGSVGHLVFNMLSLWFFGPMVEERLGPRRFLPFYLLSGAGGALLYLVLLMLGFRIGYPWVPLVGASAGIFGVLIVSARIAPYRMVMVYGVLPVPLKTLAWAFIAIAAYTVWTSGYNSGGQAAHLGGAGVGYLLWEFPGVLDLFALGRVAWRRRPF